VTDFYKHRVVKGGRENKCKECRHTYDKSHYNSTLNRAKHFKRDYKITLEDYDQMLEHQGGVCAACSGRHKDGRRLHVDHDHKTGQVRGLLCTKCNTAIGLMNDDVMTAMKIVSYLCGRDHGG
jgi:hypothetical protein